MHELETEEILARDWEVLADVLKCHLLVVFVYQKAIQLLWRLLVLRDVVEHLREL